MVTGGGFRHNLETGAEGLIVRRLRYLTKKRGLFWGRIFTIKRCRKTPAGEKTTSPPNAGSFESWRKIWPPQGGKISRSRRKGLLVLKDEKASGSSPARKKIKKRAREGKSADAMEIKRGEGTLESQEKVLGRRTRTEV